MARANPSAGASGKCMHVGACGGPRLWSTKQAGAGAAAALSNPEEKVQATNLPSQVIFTTGRLAAHTLETTLFAPAPTTSVP